MKQISVNWFAAYRDATGTTGEAVQTSAETAQALFSEMILRHPKLTVFNGALVAINDEMADWNSPLADGDRVLFFPPVAGG